MAADPSAQSVVTSAARHGSRTHLARWTLTAFLVTFLATRSLVLLIMARRIPDVYLHVGGTHVHHLNYGIFLLAGVGAYLLLGRPAGRRLTLAAVLYGIGLALTFDEFGLWLHLGGAYWQRASFDAVAVIAGLLGLFAAAPELRSFRLRHWWVAAGLLLALVVFAVLLLDSLRYVERHVAPRLERIEAAGPR